MRVVRCLSLIGLACLPGLASADLWVGLKLDHSVYLQYERIDAFVTVSNDSEFPLVVSTDPKQANAQVDFYIEKAPDSRVERLSQKPLVDRFQLDSDEQGVFTTDLTHFYDLRNMVRYTLWAGVETRGQRWLSNKIIIDVVKGLDLNSVTRAVPGYADVERIYSLRYWAREKKEFLFLSVDEEPSGMNYGVVELGPLVRVLNPLIEVDRHGNVKTWHQSGVDMFTKTTFKSTRDGVEFSDQSFHTADGSAYPFRRPRTGEPEPLQRSGGRDRR